MHLLDEAAQEKTQAPRQGAVLSSINVWQGHPHITTSLDGYIASPDGSVDWLFTAGDSGYDRFFAGVRTLVMGRVTYGQTLGFGDWPWPGKRIIVLTKGTGRPTPNGEVFLDDLGQIDLDGYLADGDMWLVGGGQVNGMFLEWGWIDVIDLFLHPFAIGAGIPRFPAGIPQVSFVAQEVQTYEDGMVRITYVRKG